MSVSSTVHRSAAGDSFIDSDDDQPPQQKDLPECKVKRNYSCATCDFFTQNPRHYLYHLRDVHEEKVRIYECPNCLYASKHFQKLLRHAKMVHDGGSGEAAAAPPKKQKLDTKEIVSLRAASPQEVDDEDSLLSDDNENDNDGGVNTSVFKCSVCDFIAKTRAQLQKHEREEHIKTKFFRCTKCSYATHMKARFTKHVKYHSMPMIKCDMCDFRTPYKWNLDRHCKNHNGRGAFKCSACNFTADIKQSLTVHEMNHHVPPVGQAAGLGVGRRRNKVGASDATAAEEAARQQQEQDQVSIVAANPDSSVSTIKKTTKQHNPEQRSFGPDFVHPDDIVQHANGNYYFKNKKCSYCSFKAAFDKDMAKHEKKVHNIVRESQLASVNNNNNSSTKSSSQNNTKKPVRPIPNLIPIPAQTSVKLLPKKQRLGRNHADCDDILEEPAMSQQDIEKICANSSNSALKDFASLFGSEDVFKTNSNKVPDLIPAYTSTPNKNMNHQDQFKQKNASFFDSLKEKLMTACNDLTCTYCGHESKCLTEQMKHQKVCKKFKDTSQTIINLPPNLMNSSSRCQYCRQRCKSTSDLYLHLQKCEEAIKILGKSNNSNNSNNDDQSDLLSYSSENDLKIDETQSETSSGQPHPMENRVFVWNNIEVPMDIEVDDSKYEYTDNEKVDDNVSLDLSIRTQSPNSESSYVGPDYTPNVHMSRHRSSPTPAVVVSSDKIPTHGNDISVAQHKRVFKCPHCSFWASTASRFHVHIVGHLNKKPFECSLCAYRSNWRWDITKHIKLKSVRDPQHESAKVLMTDETGRRNYTKYNKYLTEIHVSGSQSLDTSGGSGTRHRHADNRNSSPGGKSDAASKLTTNNNNNNKSSGHVVGDGQDFNSSKSLRPPPALKAADGFFGKNGGNKKANNENRRTLFKCKKCNFRDASREILLAHVKGHYPLGSGCVVSGGSTQEVTSSRGASPDKDEASVSTSVAKGSQAPFRCGHCNQVSNWKHVIQRHCRLKHSGDIRVVSNKNGQEKLEVEEQTDEPDHVDVHQDGIFKCNSCPYSTDNHSEFQGHLPGHSANNESVMKCHYCNYFVCHKDDMYDHLKLHGISDPEDFLNRVMGVSSNVLDCDLLSKRFKCLICPYVTNSKSQYTYHKQFHKPRGGQYNCTQCSYNVSKRHLLHQHLKVHGINVTPQKQNGDVIDLDEISDEIEEITPPLSNSLGVDSQNFADIPLVWVSKNGKFSKMFKCRFCPHVNLRKVNIQEHEKMHSVREKNPNSSRGNDVEHHCTECNYVCNNAGVLSSHSKVHQGLYGTVHCLVDLVKSDDEQIRELSKFLNPPLSDAAGVASDDLETPDSDVDDLSTSSGSLYFCKECPARFLKESEYKIHSSLHGVRLFYKCRNCTYSARQKPHLLAHDKVHTTEYQDRTGVLLTLYPAVNSQPELIRDEEDTWVVVSDDLDDLSLMINNNCNKPSGSKSNCVPLSGTELFAQKNEAEQKHKEEQLNLILTGQEVVQKPDPQFGVLMHGNPKFTYPTYMKNGRMKEKRYKCHKCPSAFEKREQYKVHLNLHGSNQRYNCDHCDYSVKYYANYVQHLKKHKMNADAQVGIVEEEIEVSDGGDEDKNKLSLGDQQAFKILQQRLMLVNNNNNNNVTSNSASPSKEDDSGPKKLFTCTSCPYVNHRKDAVDNHMRRHVSVSGVRSGHTCEHCDYSVPQLHFLRDHTKLHFMPKNSVVSNSSQVEGFMVCDNLKLVSKKSVGEEGGVIFEETGGDYLPELGEEKFLNNNEGEKKYVDRGTGEVNSDNVITDKMDES